MCVNFFQNMFPGDDEYIPENFIEVNNLWSVVWKQILKQFIILLINHDVIQFIYPSILLISVYYIDNYIVENFTWSVDTKRIVKMVFLIM